MVLSIQDIPSFEYTNEIASLCRDIEVLLKQSRNIRDQKIKTKLRKISKLKSINSSLAIESNSLTLEAMQDIIDGKLVEGPFDEIVEAKNAVKAYSMMKGIDLYSIEDFLRIEETLMFGLVPANGFRESGVGVYNGTDWDYIAPPATEVVPMMGRLFHWSENSGHPGYLKGAIVHFYLESIHPLRDGNGRIGRLWHNETMARENKVFKLLSIENLIHEHQDEYYEVLKQCQQDMQCNGFVVFCLRLIRDRLAKISHLQDPVMSRLLNAMSEEFMSASEIMERLGMSNRTYFLKNYIRPAVDCGFVEMLDPEHPRSSVQKYRSNLLR